MLESLSTEMMLGSGLLGISGLVMAASYMMARRPQVTRKTVNIDNAVQNAPYHRLHNVLPRQV